MMDNGERRETPGARQRREVAEALIAMVKDSLAKGEKPPWRKPWVGGFGAHRTGRKGGKGKYQRWNAWSTWIVATRNGYRSERWYTEAQGTKLGWRLKPGAPHASIIVPMMGRSADEGEFGFGGDWGQATVYNHEAFDGAPTEPPPAPWDDVAGVARVIALYRAVGLDLRTEGRAFYRYRSADGDDDFIGLPAAETFQSATGWAGTALHELIHWTGHASRLGRLGPSTTEADYALEELVAELGSAVLGAELRLAAGRIDDDEHHAYLTHWARRIQDDPDALPTALERANSAVDFLRAIAGTALTAAAGDPGVAAVRDVPRTLHEGRTWRGPAKPRLAVQRREPPVPALILGRQPAAAIAEWYSAALRWRQEPASDAPVLLVTGAPGDGAESLTHWLCSFMAGDERAGRVLVRTDVETLPWSVTPPSGFEPCTLRRADGERLPAWAFVPSGTPSAALDPAPPLPASGADVVLTLANYPAPFPTILVGRQLRVRDIENPAGVFVADLSVAPLPREAALWRLGKSDSRLWTAVRHRSIRTLRDVESWTPRLRTSAPWLDGHIHPVRDRLDLLKFANSAPFAPVVLRTAQAVLDALAREGHSATTLPRLMEQALVWAPLRSAAALIPLDVLVGPVFGRSASGPAPADDPRPSVTYDRARFVVQLLQLCPELSRGSKSLALMLLTSMDDDLDALGGEIEALQRPRSTGGPSKGRLERRNHSWSCDVPLRVST